MVRRDSVVTTGDKGVRGREAGREGERERETETETETDRQTDRQRKRHTDTERGEQPTHYVLSQNSLLFADTTVLYAVPWSVTKT